MDGIPVVPASRFPKPSDEDLPALSRLAWRLSAKYCGSCRNYHVVWPYLRAIGANGSGPEFRWDEQRDLLAEAVAGLPEVRWLLAGSADAGLLALVAAAMKRRPGVPYEATVVDRCETPLGLCRAYADAAGVNLRTVVAELTAFENAGTYDAVLLHHTIVFVPPAEQAGFLRHIATLLKPSGRLFMSFSHDPPEMTEPLVVNPVIGRWREAQIRAAAASGEAEPPEDVEAFVARLRTIRDGIRGPDRRRTVDSYSDMVADSGLDVERIVPLPKLASDPVPEWHPRARAILQARKADAAGS